MFINNGTGRGQTDRTHTHTDHLFFTLLPLPLLHLQELCLPLLILTKTYAFDAINMVIKLTTFDSIPTINLDSIKATRFRAQAALGSRTRPESSTLKKSKKTSKTKAPRLSTTWKNVNRRLMSLPFCLSRGRSSGWMGRTTR